nr:DUF3987 domain-containing protein [uncultured Marinifilum sp.]
MTKSKFEINNWINKDSKQLNICKNILPYVSNPNTKHSPSEEGLGEVLTDLEQITQRIETTQTDITHDYNNWLNIGFALSHQLQEKGREYYHRISKFHPEYNPKECDDQYNKCLKSNKEGITIKSLFYMAKKEGINISFPYRTDALPCVSDLSSNKQEKSDFLPESTYSNLPNILAESCEIYPTKRERDIFFVGALSILSGCLPNTQGNYAGKEYSPNLFSFIIAPAASGKGCLNHAKMLAQKWHDSILQQSRDALKKYEIELQNYQAIPPKQRANIEPPEKPPFQLLFIPADSSSAAIIQTLMECNEKGIICETEADTLTTTFKQDWGGYSDLLRKVYEHEPITYKRKTNHEYIEIKDPKLSVVLSGTPGQVHSLLGSSENGLFSRFLFYNFKDNPVWKDVSPSANRINYKEFFTKQSDKVYEMVQTLKQYPTIVDLSNEQWEKLNNNFTEKMKHITTFYPESATASLKRLGSMCFRICMLLTTLRKIDDGDTTSQLICSDHDFDNAMNLINCFLEHTLEIYQHLPQEKKEGGQEPLLRFYNTLPHHFTRQEAIQIGKNLQLAERTTDRYLKKLKGSYLNMIKPGHYQKI